MATSSETQTVIDRPGFSFLDTLASPAFRHYRYYGRRQFQDDFEEAAKASQESFSEWFIATNVNKDTFDRVFSKAEESPFSCWTAYDPVSEYLLVRTISGFPHEIASSTFSIILAEAVMPTRVALTGIGSAWHSGFMGMKGADQAWRPHRLPPGRNLDWPSAVLEVAFSESYAKLQADLRYWARASGGDVKVILTLKIDPRDYLILIEKWEYEMDGRYRHAQTVTMEQRTNGIEITGAPLVIGFEHMFLRKPTIPREADIRIRVDALTRLAESVFEEMHHR
ncbi:hypothetical protein BJY00DRAFT_315573 [Aspergillus carlsbadensis]|nr:hypothetical protein BJY00DRAFT_315573 [Aspergillus carlsbadensis]